MSAEKTAIIYARVSTARQADDELPIAGQIERCQAKASDLGATVVRVFSDGGISGQSDNRPAFQDAIAFCEAFEPDYFLTWSTNRFGRNKIDAGLYKRRLDRCGIEIVYILTPIDRSSDGGWMLEGVLEIFDEYYCRQVSADTLRSLMKNAREGHWNGGNPPFGYRPEPDPNYPKRKRLQPDDIESDVVRRIFEMRLQGRGTKTIAMALNENNMLHRDRLWSKGAISSVLRNEAVIGRTVFGRKDRAAARNRPRDQWIVVDSHEPIVSLEVWGRVQSLMGDSALAGGGTPKSHYIFTGILRCGVCGSSMQMESASGRSKQYHYYNCRSHQKTGACPSRRISSPDFDQFLVDEILTKLLTPKNLKQALIEIKETCGEWARDHNRRRRALLKQAESTTTKLNRLYDLFELHGKEAPNLADLTRRLRAHNAEIKRIEQAIGDVDAEQPPTVEVTPSDVDDLAEILRTAVMSNDDPKQLRHFFSTFIRAIVVENDRVVIEYDPEKLVNRPVTEAVHSEVIWLPGRTPLRTRQGESNRTRSLTISLPDRFCRAA